MFTLLYLFGENNSFLIGSKGTKNCLQFDIKNQKFSDLASLNEERYTCGAIKHNKTIYAFGGFDDYYDYLSTVEKLNLDSECPIFEVIALENQQLLQQTSFISFYNLGKIIVTGGKTDSLIEFDPDTESIVETEFKFRHIESFYYIH